MQGWIASLQYQCSTSSSTDNPLADYVDLLVTVEGAVPFEPQLAGEVFGTDGQ